MRRLLLTFWLAACLCALPAAAQQRIDKLLHLMQQRLELAPLVAQIKWNNHLPVDDPVREEQLLDKVPQLDRPFLRAQFEASKFIQLQCQRNWESQHSGVFSSAPTLPEVRSRLDQVTKEMLQALQEARSELSQPELLEEALTHFPENEAWNRALEPLR